MVRGRDQEKYLFSDCAINVNPSAQELAEIAVDSAKTAELFDIDPKVAMLSFSTKGSAKAPEVDKVVEATKIAQELAPEYEIDGELQFDAAYISAVAQLKAPESEVAGKATVLSSQIYNLETLATKSHNASVTSKQLDQSCKD